MRFKAIEVEIKPFIVWLETTEPLGSLVVPESEVPATQFGVCPLKIVDGELYERTAEEMEDFETEWLSSQKINEQYAIIDRLKNTAVAFFTYGGKNFPMNDSARAYYLAIEKTTAKESYDVLTVDGSTAELISANKAAFLEAYYEKLIELTQPEEIV